MLSKINKFFLNTSMGGFRFLATTENDKNKSQWQIWITKIFWVIFIGISIYSMFVILAQNADDYDSQATTINLDTNYKDWNNTFPAISVCVTKGRSTNKIKDFLTAYWNTTNQTAPIGIRYYKIILSYIFLNPYQPLDGIILKTCSDYNETCGVDLSILKRYLLPQSCKDFMRELIYFNRRIDNCESIFKHYKTEIGDCFTANSLYSNGGSLDDFRNLPLKYMNSDKIDRVLEFKYLDLELVAFKLFIHSPDELPDGNSNSHGLRKSDARTFVGLKTTEIRNQADVKFESVKRRQCQFPYEHLGNSKIPYSISNCFAYERVQRELLNCNCTLPIGYIPANTSICNLDQFQCVKDLNDDGDDEQSDSCSLPSCIAMEIEEISDIESNIPNSLGHLMVEVMNKPTLRYVRRVIETKLDIIVEFGGIIGLFLGASILSLLEVIFLLVDYKHKNSN
ncbi:unnamed protein product [Diamesa tonsa]